MLQILNKPVRYLREIDFRGIRTRTLDTLIVNIRKNTNSRNTNIDAVIKLFGDIKELLNATLAQQAKGIAEQIGYHVKSYNFIKMKSES